MNDNIMEELNMTKSTQRKKQAANMTNKTATKKATSPVVAGSERQGLNRAPAGLPKKGDVQSFGKILGDMTDPKVSAAAADIYAKSKAIDSMCRVIENAQGRTMEEKLDALDRVVDRENEIKREAHRKTMEDRYAALEIVGTILGSLFGLGVLNKKGIIKLPTISIF